MGVKKKKNRAVFLDRDGTLNFDPGYLNDPEKLRLLRNVGRGLKKLQNAGFMLIVITNQSGIARGKFSKKTLDAIHERLKEKLSKFGVRLDAIYYCPHHPDEKCQCRKPKALLVKKAAKDFCIDIKRSFVVGNDSCDQGLAKRIGCRFVQVGKKDLGPSVKMAKDMLQAARMILSLAKNYKKIAHKKTALSGGFL